MRKLLAFILIIGVIGALEQSLRTTGGTQAVEKNIDTLTKADKLASPDVGTLMPKPSPRKIRIQIRRPTRRMSRWFKS